MHSGTSVTQAAEIQEVDTAECTIAKPTRLRNSFPLTLLRDMCWLTNCPFSSTTHIDRVHRLIYRLGDSAWAIKPVEYKIYFITNVSEDEEKVFGLDDEHVKSFGMEDMKPT